LQDCSASFAFPVSSQGFQRRKRARLEITARRVRGGAARNLAANPGKQSSLDPAQLVERHGESFLAWITAELSHNLSEAVTVPRGMDVARRIISSQCHGLQIT